MPASQPAKKEQKLKKGEHIIIQMSGMMLNLGGPLVTDAFIKPQFKRHTTKRRNSGHYSRNK